MPIIVKPTKISQELSRLNDTNTVEAILVPSKNVLEGKGTGKDYLNISTDVSDSLKSILDKIVPRHLREWIDSAIVNDIIVLNFDPIVGDGDTFAFLYPNPPRRNDGRLTQHALDKYHELEGRAGWAYQDRDTGWGCVKLDIPRWNDKEKKIIKYEHPRGVPTEVFKLRVSWRIGQNIAAKAGLEVEYLERMGAIANPCDEDRGFWDWVNAHPSITIIITEGVKKAASLLSAGYCAIGLPGIYGGYRRKNNGVPVPSSLIPQLKAFAQTGREFVFCFDNDEKPQTIRNVRKAIDRTGGLLERRGCKVSVMKWNHHCKGIDDLIAAMGVDELDRLYSQRKSLATWKVGNEFDLTRYKVHKVNSRYLDANDVPPKLTSRIIGIKSAKGTGKTKYLSELVAPFIESGRGVLALSHRTLLAKTLAERIGIPHLSETQKDDTGLLFGAALCVDSLWKINPDRWEGAAIVIDECEQVLGHLLNSNTLKDKRSIVLEKFKQLIVNTIASGGTIILSDADLSSASIELIKQLSEEEPNLWILQNDYVPNQGRKIINYKGNDNALIAEAVAAIERGENIIIHTSSQKVKGKKSTQNLESLIEKRILKWITKAIGEKFPDIEILRIDSETVADPNHPAYGCIENINKVVTGFQVVIASPTIETGISIDVNHFDAVYCLANGVQTVDAVCQALERVRSDVPRHISITRTAVNSSKIGNGSTSPQGLYKSQQASFKAIHSVLSLADDFCEVEGSSSYKNTWALFASKHNAGFNNYEEAILEKLKSEGYEIIDYQSDRNDDREVGIELKEVAEENYQAERDAIIAAPNPSDSQYERLTKAKAKTKDERYIERKGKLVRRYLTEDITDELIVKDDEGWFPQLQLLYYLSLGREHVEDRDRQGLKRLSNERGAVFAPDANKASLSVPIRVLEALGIDRFFGEDKTFTRESLAEFGELAKSYRYAIKDVLGVRLSENCTPIQAANAILGKLGLKLELIDRIRVDGKLTRRYAGIDPLADGRGEIFARWKERDDRIKLLNSTLSASIDADVETVLSDPSPQMAKCSTGSIYIYNKTSGTGLASGTPTLGILTEAKPKSIPLERDGGFAVGDNVRSRVDGTSLSGTVIDFDLVAAKYQIDWGTAYAGRTWFHESELVSDGEVAA